MDENKSKQSLFGVFNEIGIIHQLAVTMLNRRLPDGLHVSHFGVINHMCRLGDGDTPQKLASAFQVTKATMTNTLTKLSERGLIKVQPNPEDGRSKLVYLTEEGRAFHNRAIESLEPMFRKLGEDLDIEGLMKIIPELQKLRLYLDENRDL